MGRALRGKGHLEAMAAIVRALPSRPEWTARFMVSDPVAADREPETVQALRDAAKGFNGRIRVDSNVPYAEVKAAWEAAAVGMVLTTGPEPFGRTALEALASGAALITSGRGGLAEICGPCAVTADPGEADGLAAALGQLMDEPERRAELARAGRKRVEALFDIRTVARQMDDFIDACVGQGLACNLRRFAHSDISRALPFGRRPDNSRGASGAGDGDKWPFRLGKKFAFVIGLVVFAGGALGLSLQRVLPETFTTAGPRDMIGAVVGLLTLLSALTMGLLIWTAYGVYAGQNTAIQTLAAKVLQLDLELADYGPDANPERARLRTAVGKAIDDVWGVRERDKDFIAENFAAAVRGLRQRGRGPGEPPSHDRRAEAARWPKQTRSSRRSVRRVCRCPLL